MSTPTVAAGGFTRFQFWETIRWDLPTVMTVVLLVAFAVSLVLVQLRSDFDLADMYRDDNGKVSSVRVLSVGAWVVASWYVMQDMLDAVPTPEVYWAYVITFSAAKVLDKAAEKWTGELPWTKK